MQTTNTSPPIAEPLWRLLARNLAIAAVVSAAITVRHEFRAFLPVVALALWPALGGHYVELAFGKLIRARISPGRFAQTVVRLLVWFAGGVLLYLCMCATSRVLPIRALPLRMWWCGSLLFIGLELGSPRVSCISTPAKLLQRTRVGKC
jgi:hypothetical protein